VRAALTAVSDEARNVAAGGLGHRGRSIDRSRGVIYTESHDEVANGSARVPEEVWPGYAHSWPSRKRASLGAAIV